LRRRATVAQGARRRHRRERERPRPDGPRPGRGHRLGLRQGAPRPGLALIQEGRETMRWRLIATGAVCALVLAAGGPGAAAGAAAAPSPDRPAPPTNLRVPPLAFDSDSITIAWEKPASHAEVVDYHVFMDGVFAGSASQAATSPARPFVDRFYGDPANGQQV